MLLVKKHLLDSQQSTFQNVSHLFHNWFQNILFYNHSGNFQQDPHTCRHFGKDQVSTRYRLNHKVAQVLARNAQKDGAGSQVLVPVLELLVIAAVLCLLVVLFFF